MNRVLLPSLVFAAFGAVQPLPANRSDFRLQVVPAIVYKVDDPGGSRTSSFVFDVAVLCTTDCALTPISARVELSAAGATVEQQVWTTEMLAKIKRTSFRIGPNTPLMAPVRAITLPEAFDLRFYFRDPTPLAIDSLTLRLTVADSNGRGAEQSLSIPIRYYRQKTALIVPFRGHGVVGQDFVTSGGHGGHGEFSNEFAVDLDGLDQNYGELSDANENAADAGYAARYLRLRLEQWSTSATTYPTTSTRERNLTPTTTRL
jgi:hypothetical protein